MWDRFGLLRPRTKGFQALSTSVSAVTTVTDGLTFFIDDFDQVCPRESEESAVFDFDVLLSYKLNLFLMIHLLIFF